jgi:DNA-binding FrmR family transcriptional regulator
MNLQDEQTKEKLLARLRRVEGQVRGVQSMLSDDRDCREILQQLTAIHSAVQATSLMLMQAYAADCLVNLDTADSAQREAFVQDWMSLLGKAP